MNINYIDTLGTPQANIILCRDYRSKWILSIACEARLAAKKNISKTSFILDTVDRKNVIHVHDSRFITDQM